MDRCYRILIVSLLVLCNMLIPVNTVLALEYYRVDNMTEPCFMQGKKEEKKEAVINLNDEEILLLSKLEEKVMKDKLL